MWRVVHRLEGKVSFLARLLKMLTGQRRLRIPTRPRLHRVAVLFGLAVTFAVTFLFLVDLLLDGALRAGCFFRTFAEGDEVHGFSAAAELHHGVLQNPSANQRL